MAHIKDDSTLTILWRGRTHTISNDHVNFHEVWSLCQKGLYDSAVSKLDVTEAINTFGGGKVTVSAGVVKYNGEPLHNALTRRILGMIRQGETVKPLVNFLERLMNNPSGRAINELYRFLECNSLPITQDGHLLAYKRVRSDYTDVHTGSINNHVGQEVSMPRWQVNDDPNQTCSNGLHFCSLEYLKGFGSGPVMIVKVDPADVVSIPVDYNNSKARCCRYRVVAEHDSDTRDFHGDRAVMNF